MTDYLNLAEMLRMCASPLNKSCMLCPYECGAAVCIMSLQQDAATALENLLAENEKLKAKFDMARVDLQEVHECTTCIHAPEFIGDCDIDDCNCHWQWRGDEDV